MYFESWDVITGRIKQYYVVSSVDSSSFQQSCSDLLCFFVQLRTCGCADCYTLPVRAKKKLERADGLTKYSLMGILYACHLCIQQHIENMIGISLCSPLQGF